MYFLDREALEKPFGLRVVHCDRAFSPTSEGFVVVSGVGENTDKTGIETAARKASKEYAAERPGGVLYWRATPEIRTPEDTGTPGLWSFWMRLLISSKDPRA